MRDISGRLRHLTVPFSRPLCDHHFGWLEDELTRRGSEFIFPSSSLPAEPFWPIGIQQFRARQSVSGSAHAESELRRFTARAKSCTLPDHCCCDAAHIGLPGNSSAPQEHRIRRDHETPGLIRSFQSWICFGLPLHWENVARGGAGIIRQTFDSSLSIRPRFRPSTSPTRTRCAISFNTVDYRRPCCLNHRE